MYKKFILTFFLVGLIILFIAITNYDLSNIEFYTINFVIMLLGLLLYPVSKNFKRKIDYLIIPFIIVLMFNIINILFIKNFSTNISLINLIFGIFGFGQYYYELQSRKSSGEKNNIKI